MFNLKFKRIVLKCHFGLYCLTARIIPVRVSQAMPSGDQAEPSGRLTPIEFDRDKLMIRIEVTLNADPTAISPVVEGIMEMARRMDCASGKEFEIETALREALANAILHGCKNDPTKKVQCCVSCDEEHGLLIVVRDPGTGFEPKQVPDPSAWRERLFEPRARDLPDQSAHG